MHELFLIIIHDPDMRMSKEGKGCDSFIDLYNVSMIEPGIIRLRVEDKFSTTELTLRIIC